MNRDDLNKTLEALHQELSGAQNISADTVALLKTLTSDIQRILDHPALSADTLSADAASPVAAVSGSDQDKSLSERLREAAIEFEVRHPQIGGLLERLTDGLASIGI